MDLITLVQKMVSEAFQCFSEYGMQMNLGAHKTCAVLGFKGEGAPALRKQFIIEDGGCPFACGQDQFWLSI